MIKIFIAISAIFITLFVTFISFTIFSDLRITPKEIKEVMETCVDLEVPSKVDIDLGESWGDK